MSRPIKELLEITLENQQCFVGGLCGWLENLYRSNLIEFEEWDELQNYADNNKPSIYSSVDRFRHRNSDYWWKSGDITPRIKWIKKHIKKNA